MVIRWWVAGAAVAVVVVSLVAQSVEWALVPVALGALLFLFVRRDERPDVLAIESPRTAAVFDEIPGVSPEVRAEIAAKVAESYPKTAAVVHSRVELTAMLKEKPPEWPWAALVSVLVQRRDAVRNRLRDSRLGYATPSGESARTDREVTRFVMDRLEEVDLLVGRLEGFMLSPAFRELLTQCADEDIADADDILHTANRLMDFHDQFLQLAERCRGLKVPSEHALLLRNCARVVDVPLDGYRRFIDDFVAVVAQIPELLHYGRGAIDAGQVALSFDDDSELIELVVTEVRRIMNR